MGHEIGIVEIFGGRNPRSEESHRDEDEKQAETNDGRRIPKDSMEREL